MRNKRGSQACYVQRSTQRAEIGRGRLEECGHPLPDARAVHHYLWARAEVLKAAPGGSSGMGARTFKAGSGSEIEGMNSASRSFLTVTSLRAAREARSASGAERTLLHGRPIYGTLKRT